MYRDQEMRKTMNKTMELLGGKLMLLRVPFDDKNQAEFVQRKDYPIKDPLPPIPFSEVGPLDLLDSVLVNLHHMHAHRVMYRMGWKELGLDGYTADYYSLLQ